MVACRVVVNVGYYVPHITHTTSSRADIQGQNGRSGIEHVQSDDSLVAGEGTPCLKASCASAGTT